jgi:hypothetical protein
MRTAKDNLCLLSPVQEKAEWAREEGGTLDLSSLLKHENLRRGPPSKNLGRDPSTVQIKEVFQPMKSKSSD